MSLTGIPQAIEFFDQPGMGEVEETITLNQLGRVRFMATTWYAQFYFPLPPQEILPGQKVRVIGREGLTLLVVPIDDWMHPPMPLASQQTGMNGLEEGQWHQKLSSWFTTWLG